MAASATRLLSRVGGGRSSHNISSADAIQEATAAPPCSGQLMEFLGVQDHSRGGYQPTFPPGVGITNTNKYVSNVSPFRGHKYKYRQVSPFRGHKYPPSQGALWGPSGVGIPNTTVASGREYQYPPEYPICPSTHFERPNTHPDHTPLLRHLECYLPSGGSMSCIG